MKKRYFRKLSLKQEAIEKKRSIELLKIYCTQKDGEVLKPLAKKVSLILDVLNDNKE